MKEIATTAEGTEAEKKTNIRCIHRLSLYEQHVASHLHQNDISLSSPPGTRLSNINMQLICKDGGIPAMTRLQKEL